jgi:hypothetical protein
MMETGKPSAKLANTNARAARISLCTSAPLIQPVIRTRSRNLSFAIDDSISERISPSHASTPSTSLRTCGASLLYRAGGDMIYVGLNTLLLCLAILGRTILTAGLILCFGTMPIVQVANAQISNTSPVAIFNCPSGFAQSGSCGVNFPGVGSNQAFTVFGGTNGSTPGLSGSQVNLIPAGAVHIGLALNYQTPVNVQSFSSTFTFIPNGWNIAFVLRPARAAGSGVVRLPWWRQFSGEIAVESLVA